MLEPWFDADTNRMKVTTPPHKEIIHPPVKILSFTCLVISSNPFQVGTSSSNGSLILQVISLRGTTIWKNIIPVEVDVSCTVLPLQNGCWSIPIPVSNRECVSRGSVVVMTLNRVHILGIHNHSIIFFDDMNDRSQKWSHSIPITRLSSFGSFIRHDTQIYQCRQCAVRKRRHKLDYNSMLYRQPEGRDSVVIVGASPGLVVGEYEIYFIIGIGRWYIGNNGVCVTR